MCIKHIPYHTFIIIIYIYSFQTIDYQGSQVAPLTDFEGLYTVTVETRYLHTLQKKTQKLLFLYGHTLNQSKLFLF